MKKKKPTQNQLILRVRNKYYNEIFKEISGIDVEKELNTPKSLSGKTVKVTLDGLEYEAIIK